MTLHYQFLLHPAKIWQYLILWQSLNRKQQEIWDFPIGNGSWVQIRVKDFAVAPNDGQKLCCCFRKGCDGIYISVQFKFYN